MPEPSPDPESDEPLTVEVTRTGGFAGLTRRWEAEPASDDRERWTALVDRCPWDSASLSSRPDGADRFSWSIRAHCGPEDRAITLPDGALTGPWRELVDEVRDWRGESGDRDDR